MDKNLLLAVSLSILVYAAWFGFVEKRIAKNQPAKPAAASIAPEPTLQQAAEPARPGATAPPELKKAYNALDSAADVIHARFGNAEVQIRPHGAAITSWKFTGPRGVIELVASPVPGLLSTFPELAFKPVPGNPLTFTAADGALRVTKEFVPGGDAQLPRLKITLANAGSKPLATPAWAVSVGPGLGTIETEEKENAKMTRSLAFAKQEGGLNGKVEVFKQPGDQPGDFQWVGVDNRYFLAAVLPKAGEFAKTQVLDGHQVEVSAKSETLASGQSRSWEVPFYVGAKGQTWLSRYKMNLERSIDFGFFAQLGRFILKVLDKIHAVTGNWGWSIILLTMIIQLAMFPLTYKSLKATNAMRTLQPEIARLQQRYSKDPQKLNVEMMALYKKHGANPLGGCLPMVVQMPVFVALYNALRNAWELHGASWIFWIHDLSAKDPFYVLPVVMGALMFAQNKLNPAAGVDPAQQQMMTFMPIIFTVMFMKFPSGLVLYWLTNSLVSTLQQLALRKRLA